MKKIKESTEKIIASATASFVLCISWIILRATQKKQNPIIIKHAPTTMNQFAINTSLSLSGFDWSLGVVVFVCLPVIWKKLRTDAEFTRSQIPALNSLHQPGKTEGSRWTRESLQVSAKRTSSNLTNSWLPIISTSIVNLKLMLRIWSDTLREY